MVAIISALKEEICGILKKTDLLSVTEEKSWKLYKVNYKSRQILLLQSGIGKENVISSVSYLLDKHQISTIISLGFAGALRDDLKPGDLVLYSQLFAKDNPEIIRPDLNLFSTINSIMNSKKLSFFIHKGNSFTSDHIVYKPDQKRRYKEKYGCIAVDMESYWIAYMSRERKVPFVCVRAISDTSRQRIPNMENWFGMDGKLSIVKILKYLALNPADFFSLFSLLKNAYLAKKSLTTLFASTIDMLH
jgi:adenosylhomocysteine nucleosidase